MANRSQNRKCVTGALKLNRRQVEIKRIRGELRLLKKKFRCACQVERKGLSELRDQLPTKLKSLSTAERIKKKRKGKRRAAKLQLLSPTRLSSPKIS